ncbi:IclR family transcriptional regulator [Halomicroarcula sp. GCM10025709]|uniref:IclR family transcriptional regulator n=1 Tax=Haloarcula TaxID=2237 RepID=UPI0024C376FA|nr:IclR family transcriptional regulator [Halomicroarcula sp. YJ-61-S]
MSENHGNTERTTEKLLSIISALHEQGPQGVTELATYLDIPKSTVHYHLQALKDQGYVVQTDQKYRIGLRFLEIGGQARRRIPLFEAATDEINDLANETGDLAILMVEEQGLGTILYKQAGNEAIDMDASIGRRARLHDRALGKAILAHLPEDRIEAIVQEYGLRQTTEHTIHDREELFDSLEQIREEGVSYNRGEAVEGLRGVAVPILTDDGEVLGAISIAGPAARLDGDRFTEELPNRLFQAKNVIELKIQKNANSQLNH